MATLFELKKNWVQKVVAMVTYSVKALLKPLQAFRDSKSAAMGVLDVPIFCLLRMPPPKHLKRCSGNATMGTHGAGSPPA